MSVPSDSTPPTTRGPKAEWAAFKRALVFWFVAIHLAIIVGRNPIDLWPKPIKKWCKERGWWSSVEPWDERTKWYEDYLGVEQGWNMFRPPVARYAAFLTTKLVFTDESEEYIYSSNDLGPDYFRIGGWRQRKLEDGLAYTKPEDLRDNEDLPRWQAYVRWRIESWRDEHPDDPRSLERVVLLGRTIVFPTPDEDPRRQLEPEVYVIGVFNPDGTLR